MINYQEILKENPNGVFATQDGERVKSRIFQYLFSDGNKVYFCTGSQKPVYTQLQANPYASFCVFQRNYSLVLSVNGKVVFTEDSILKKRVLDENPPIKEIYGSPDSPIFKLFYLDVNEVETFSFEEGSKRYLLDIK